MLRFPQWICISLTLIGLIWWGVDGTWMTPVAWAAGDDSDKIQIQALEPDPRGGKAYRLIYHLPLDADIYWRFKTDFDNDFLVGNKFIKVHRLVSIQDRTVITENVYSYDPAHVFKWQTTIHPEARRPNFRLLNADECRQIFHHGSIEIEAQEAGTRVTQTAYFDFWGVALWYHYPWSGGMRDLLRYTVAWEQQLAVRLKHYYPPPPDAVEEPVLAPSE
jgi:hypothetical protein